MVSKEVNNKTKLHFDKLQLKLYQIVHEDTVSEKNDFYSLLDEMSVYYSLTSEELLTRGFRKAYRQAVEGV